MFLWGQALDCRLKQMRCASTVDWQDDEKKFKTVAEVSLELVDAYLAQPEEDLKRHLFSAKLHLRGILKKAEVSYAGFKQAMGNPILTCVSSGKLEVNRRVRQAGGEARSRS